MQKPLAGALLVSDVDGTLITKDFELPKKNILAIKKFTELGGDFTLASGRSFSATMLYANQVNITCPLITYNGAAIYDTKSEKLVWQIFLPKAAREALELLISQFPDIGAEIHSEGRLYLVQDSAEAQKHLSDEALTHEVRTLEALPRELPVNKILFAAPTARLKEVQEYAAKHAGIEGAYLTFTSPVYLEMIPSDANKGAALRELIRMGSFDRGRVYAIGDYVNDISLLREAAHTAAVGTAPDEVKAHAQYLTCSNNEGAVADFIEHIIKNLS